MDGDFINSQDKCLTCSWGKKSRRPRDHRETEEKPKKKIKKWPFNDMKCFVYELNSKVCVCACVFFRIVVTLCVCVLTRPSSLLCLRWTLWRPTFLLHPVGGTSVSVDLCWFVTACFFSPVDMDAECRAAEGQGGQGRRCMQSRGERERCGDLTQ